MFVDFEKVAELKINLEIIALGQMKLDFQAFPKDLTNLHINKGTFKTLGVWFSKGHNESAHLNYDDRLDKIKMILQIWRQRSLSWKGRIMIIKTLILPQVTHLFGMTYTPQTFLDQLDKLIFSFLWGDKPHRIKRETIIAMIEDGGLKMPDIYSFHMAQKIMCVKNLIAEDGKVLNLFLTTTGVQKFELKHRLSPAYLKKLTCSPFYAQLLQCWFDFKTDHPENKNIILNEYLFLNSHITINNCIIHPKDVGLDSSFIDLRLNDIVGSNNELYTSAEILQKFNSNTNLLCIYSLLSAIPTKWKQNINTPSPNFRRSPNFSFILNNSAVPLEKVTSKNIYCEIVKRKIKPPSALSTWLNLFPFLENFNWQKVYSLVYSISKEPYLQTFQYKVLNRSINCRYNLYKWNVLTSGKCYYCPEIDTIEHHFYYCGISKRFWNNVYNWLHGIIRLSIDLSVCEILFGLVHFAYGDKETFNTLNFVVLLGKWYINNCKNSEKELLMSPFLNIVKNKLTILKMNYELSAKSDVYKSKFAKLDKILL